MKELLKKIGNAQVLTVFGDRFFVCPQKDKVIDITDDLNAEYIKENGRFAYNPVEYLHEFICKYKKMELVRYEN